MGNAFPPPSGGVTFPITIAEGGTGQTGAAAALAALGGASLAGAAFTPGQVSAFRFQATGQAGAAASVHYAGGTTGGPPTSGTWSTGDVAVDPVNGLIYVCTSGGTPGTWHQVGTAPALPEPGVLLGVNQFAPGTAAPFSTTSATMAAVDTGVICTPSFTAPASGSVIVTAQFTVTQATAGTAAAFGLANTSGGAAQGQVVTCNVPATSSAGPTRLYVQWLVTGLTPGTPNQFDLTYGTPSGTLTITAWGNTSQTAQGTTRAEPAVMTVTAV